MPRLTGASRDRGLGVCGLRLRCQLAAFLESGQAERGQQSHPPHPGVITLGNELFPALAVNKGYHSLV